MASLLMLVVSYLEGGEWKELKNVHISGLMMMASNVDDRNQIKRR